MADPFEVPARAGHSLEGHEPGALESAEPVMTWRQGSQQTAEIHSCYGQEGFVGDEACFDDLIICMILIHKIFKE